MKQNFRYTLLLMSSLLLYHSSKASNKLSIADISGAMGARVTLPVYLTNSNSEIVAAQFRLTVPDGVTVDTESARPNANRAKNHTVVVQQNTGSYTVMLFSSNNSPIAGNSGQLLTVDLLVGTGFTPGGAYSLTLSDVIISSKEGENVGNDFSSAQLHIGEVTDFVVTDVKSGVTTVTPGDELPVSWTVSNQGGLAATGGWSEQVSLVGSNGRTQLLGTVYSDASALQAGATVSRQSVFVVPELPGMDGNVQVEVRLLPNADAGEMPEYQTNNTTRSATTVALGKRLTLTVPATATEGNLPLRCLLARSGDWTKAQTFNVSIAGDSRLTGPKQVTIAAGQSSAYFYLNLHDDALINQQSHFTITASGNGYDAFSAQMEVEDNEYPSLGLQVSKSTVTEGESFQLTVTIPKPVSEPLEVALYCEQAKRFNFNPQVTIAAGKTSATVSVEAIDDAEVSDVLSVAFTATAPRYETAEGLVLLVDNDMPDIELTLMPTTVSEGAGATAVIGTVRKLNRHDSKITVQLGDNSAGRIYYSSPTLLLEKGVEEAQFSIGVKDNATVDGDLAVDVTAAIYISSCSCAAQGSSGGSVTKRLTVVDDDGPALRLTCGSTTMLEGSHDNTLTIERNTSTASALTVTLSSDHDNLLSYSHTVTIPAGQRSVTVTVAAKDNDVQGDNQTIVFQAQASGFATGTCWVMLTDQTLPDVSIPSLTTDQTEFVTGGEMTVTLTVANTGKAPFTAPAPVVLYLSGSSSELDRLYLQEDLQPGASKVLSKTVTLPEQLGQAVLTAEINHDRSAAELLYANNRSQGVSIELLSPFTATVTPDKNRYLKGETVQLTGRATGKGTARTDVEVYIVQNGTRQVIPAKTDGAGRFTATWTPYPAQMGRFSVGACYPGEAATTAQATVDILGLRLEQNDYIICETLVGEPYSGAIGIVNPGQVAQTVSNVEILQKPADCMVDISRLTTIPADGTVQLEYTLTGFNVTKGNDWEQLQLRLTTNEGSTLDVTAYYYCRSPKGLLEASVSSIKTTMVKGQQRDYSFTVTNRGKGQTGRITLLLPNVSWMAAVTPTDMGSLDYGESAEVILRLTPANDMPLNVPQTGRIALNQENGNGLPIDYSIEPVSDNKGTLVVDVVDEYTYYAVVPDADGSRMMARAAASQPHVSGATVVVKHPVTGAALGSGVTGADGRFTVELPEGYYTINVTEPNHDAYSGTVMLDPGTTNLQDVFISFKAITYSWEVVETEVEDEYHVETTVKYETNVPKPVVIMTLPKEAPQPNSIIPIVVTNKGLITANNPVFSLSADGGFEVEVLNGEELKSLAPQQSFVFYALYKKSQTAGSRRRAEENVTDEPNPCRGLYAAIWLHYLCGTEDQLLEQIAAGRWGECGAVGGGGGGSFGGGAVTSAPWGGPGKGGGPASPASVANKSTDSQNNENNYGNGGTTPVRNCNPYIVAIAKALADCANGLIKNCMPDAIGAIYEALLKDKESLIERMEEGIIKGIDESDEFISFLKDVIETKDKIDCLYSIGECVAAFQILITGGATSRKEMPANRQATLSVLEDFLGKFEKAQQELEAKANYYLEVFGGDYWLDSDREELSAFIQAIGDCKSNGTIVLTNDAANKRPKNITLEQATAFVRRVNNTLTSSENPDKIDLTKLRHYIEEARLIEIQAIDAGFENTCAMLEDSYKKTVEYVDEQNNSVCASISLQFSQTMTLTRQAFRGTLTVFNGHDTAAMKNVKLNLEVRDEDGQLATQHEFQISAESLQQFSGELSLTSGWTLDAQRTGTATILFIPTKYAAPDTERVYSFGGTLTYEDPFTGLNVSRELYPVSLTVKPSPDLELTYFMQRDILGDDPLTLDVVEPSHPAEFALLIQNHGNGEATNVRMVTNQPEIIDNEKGLAIDFQLLSSILNGKETSLALGQSVATDFGSIPADGTAYAQWMFESTLLGHFTEYDVKATHVTSYGNPDLSLLDTVTVHELIHGFDLSTPQLPNSSTPVRAFLVNDVADAADLPDVVYFTDGRQLPLNMASGVASEQKSMSEFVLTVNGSAGSWNYGSIADPTGGQLKLANVVRKSDGKSLPPDCFWQTDRTLLDGMEWLYEHRLHFADSLAASQEQYIVTFDFVIDVSLAVESLSGAPSIDQVAKEPVKTITVVFNKDIQQETFTTADLRLCCQGEVLNASEIGIQPISGREFQVDLSALTQADGYYTLTVQTAHITGIDGAPGKDGRQTEWIQYTSPLNFSVNVIPAEGGIVAPGVVSVPYGQAVNFQATPNEGYNFAAWMVGDEVVGRDVTYSMAVMPTSTLTAMFTPRSFLVTITADSSLGTVDGGGTGYYTYGQELALVAKPIAGQRLEGWYVDGQQIATSVSLTLTVSREMTVEARFVEDYKRGDVNADGQVGIGDIVAVTNVMAGISRDPETVARADVSGDGEVGIGDIVAITNIMAGVY
ncbi:MAG: DUF5006 domain-containing protein [Prevotella sp.]|nr:DUF5006 domain-containing protein [Prevotella sp.]